MIDLGLKWEIAGGDYDILRTGTGVSVGQVRSTEGMFEAKTVFDGVLGIYSTSIEAKFVVEVSVLKKAKEVVR